jgi:hypothetical protein
MICWLKLENIDFLKNIRQIVKMVHFQHFRIYIYENNWIPISNDFCKEFLSIVRNFTINTKPELLLRIISDKKLSFELRIISKVDIIFQLFCSRISAKNLNILINSFYFSWKDFFSSHKFGSNFNLFSPKFRSFLNVYKIKSNRKKV